MDQTAVSFFHQHPDALPLYAELESRILETIPGTRIDVRKTQISLFIERMYDAFCFYESGTRRKCPTSISSCPSVLAALFFSPRVTPPVQVSAHR